MKFGHGYAWKLENGQCCHWVEPSKEALLRRNKPSDGAIPVRVQIIPYGFIGRLLNFVNRKSTHNKCMVANDPNA